MQPLTTPAPLADYQTPLNPIGAGLGTTPVTPSTPTLPALQEILNKLPQVTNILVTVKASPSVDELAAALGLTIALNNIGKHATAVFSGKIPDAMSFLKPDKTFESDVHSLRDFIISLNKEKADKLRFAQEGEIVKIFITPKANLSSEDLTYNAGDFNVEMVLAIGIANQNELDSVIAAHGKILHEATVATLTAGANPSTIGSINWAEPNLTSASAMVMQLLQAINPPVTISADIATALLTGLVANTNMFSNQNTSSQIMELAAKLMSAGANHQLVASSIGIQPGAVTATTTATTAASTLEVADTPAPVAEVAPPPTPQATNTTPMVQEASETPSTIEPQPLTSSSDLSSVALAKEETLVKEETLSPSLSDALPKPVDAAQPVIPTELMPPAQPILETPPAPAVAPETITPLGDQPVATPQPLQPIQATPTLEPTPTDPNHPDQIRSEIDQIYGSSSSTNPDTALPNSLLSNDFALSNQTPDTSVQLDQASSTTTAAARDQVSQIQPTKTSDVNSNDLLGISDLPKLEVPAELPPPPPPPPPAGAAGSTFQPTIDFSQINQS